MGIWRAGSNVYPLSGWCSPASGQRRDDLGHVVIRGRGDPQHLVMRVEVHGADVRSVGTVGDLDDILAGDLHRRLLWISHSVQGKRHQLLLDARSLDTADANR